MGGKGSGAQRKVPVGSQNPWTKPGGSLPEMVEELNEAERIIYSGLRQRISMLPWGGAADLDVVVCLTKAIRFRNEVDIKVQSLQKRYIETSTGSLKPHPAIDDFIRINDAVSELAGKLMLTPKARAATRISLDQQLQSARTSGQPEATAKEDPRSAILKLVQGGGA